MDSGIKTEETNDRKMSLQEQEQFLMETLNWISLDENDDNNEIIEAEEDVDQHFVMFYYAFRKAELLKRGKNPMDQKEIDFYDKSILNPNNEEVRVNLYNYIGESLLDLFSKDI